MGNAAMKKMYKHTYIYVYSRTVRDWIPVTAKFSAPAQTGPGAHPTCRTMRTVSFQGVKQPKRGVNHPPHMASKLKKE